MLWHLPASLLAGRAPAGRGRFTETSYLRNAKLPLYKLSQRKKEKSVSENHALENKLTESLLVRLGCSQQ